MRPLPALTPGQNSPFQRTPLGASVPIPPASGPALALGSSSAIVGDKGSPTPHTAGQTLKRGLAQWPLHQGTSSLPTSHWVSSQMNWKVA